MWKNIIKRRFLLLMHFKQMGRILTKNGVDSLKAVDFLLEFHWMGYGRPIIVTVMPKMEKKLLTESLKHAKCWNSMTCLSIFLQLYMIRQHNIWMKYIAFIAKKDLNINSIYHALIHYSRKKVKCIILWIQ